jgi:protein involved in polysaccharide export with SLBB domain
MSLRRILAWTIVIALAGPGRPIAAQDMSTSTLSPGDSIRINVWRYDQFSGQFGIGPDGRILHPLFQEIRVSDASLSSVELEIGRVLQEYVDEPVYTVEPLIHIAVTGDVNLPGTFAMAPATTLAQAIAAAGGPTQTAKRGSVKLLRLQTSGGYLERKLDLNDPGDVAFRETVRSGDQILVPQKSFSMRDVAAWIGALAGVALVIERFVND